MAASELTKTSVFNPQNILSEIEERGFLRPCRFLVSIAMTPAMISQLPTLASVTRNATVMSFWCETASIPGVMLEFQPIRRYGYGPLENKAYGAHFADIPMVFRADATGMVHNFLHSWMRMVVDNNYDEDMVTQNPATGGMPWEVGYKDDYATEVMISVFDDKAGQNSDNVGMFYDNMELDGNPSIQVHLRDAYPTAITDSPLAWAARGDYTKIGVSMTFFSWFTRTTSD